MVLLDDVPFAKRSWQQRNRIRTRNGLEFVTVPVVSTGLREQKIMECCLADEKFGKKFISTLKANYAKAAFFRDSIEELIDEVARGVEAASLVELNCRLIKWCAAKLNIKTPILMASELGVGGVRGEHLAAICQTLGYKKYLSAPGAESYLLEDEEAFEKRGIEVNIHVYEHPSYTQCFSPFMPFACSLDLVFNEGPNAVTVMRSGRRPARPLGGVTSCLEKMS